MSKLIETLKNNGWEMSTFGQCQLGDEVLTRRDKKASVYTTVCGEYECEGFTVTEDGIFPDWTPVLRAPRPERPEYAPGTVALVRIPGGTSPVRASRYNNGWIHERGWVSDMKMLSHGGEVVRVLLPADQDTPTVEVTDEMVERAAETCYLASFQEDDLDRQWEKACERFPYVADLFRREVHAVLKAALENEKEK